MPVAGPTQSYIHPNIWLGDISSATRRWTKWMCMLTTRPPSSTLKTAISIPIYFHDFLMIFVLLFAPFSYLVLDKSSWIFPFHLRLLVLCMMWICAGIGTTPGTKWNEGKLEFMLSQRGKPLLMHDGHSFGIQYIRKDKKYW